jgi:hypothetical protein
VVVGHDDVEPPGARVRDLLYRRDPAVDGEEEPAPVVGKALQRRRADAVPLVEAARQMPLDVGAERPQRQHGERRGTDPVHVVVAVDADPLPAGDRGADPSARLRHVSEQQRVVCGRLGGEKRGGARRLRVPPPNEHRRGQLADAERLGEGVRLLVGAVAKRPGDRHGRSTVRAASDGAAASSQSSTAEKPLQVDAFRSYRDSGASQIRLDVGTKPHLFGDPSPTPEMLAKRAGGR